MKEEIVFMKSEMKRKGFTLVELLIVIVVIGILSAMMMLSSTEAVSSARANNIVSNLRNLKTAALAMYTDYMDHVDKQGTKYKVRQSFDVVKQYMSQGESSGTAWNGYGIAGNTTNGKWFVYYNGSMESRVKEKLKSRASSVGLWQINNPAGDNAASADFNATSSTAVGMFVR